jgi:hypothetical protein
MREILLSSNGPILKEKAVAIPATLGNTKILKFE